MTFAAGKKLAEYRANNFCQQALENQSLFEIKELATRTRYAINKTAIPYVDGIPLIDTVIVYFNSFFATSYVCVIRVDFDEPHKPKHYEAIFHD